MASGEFKEFCRIVYERSGITLKDGKESLVASRVNKRLRALNLASYRSYLQYLQTDDTGNELVQLIDVISTNVTRFFREPAAFSFLQDRLGFWKKAGQKRFRVWCSASSSGEEPYSMAIVMAEVLGLTGGDWQILASDISTKVLAFAEGGIYPEDRLKEVSPEILYKYFNVDKKNGETLYSVKPMLRERILFRRLNLASPPFPLKGPLDCVFCRNVMIYFDRHVRIPLLAEVARLLKPGGFLALGSSESLTGLAVNLEAVQPSIYRRKT